MKKRLVAGLLACLMAFSLAACGAAETAPEAESTTHTITDLLGREVTIPNDIQRIAAIAGPTYEMVSCWALPMRSSWSRAAIPTATLWPT